MCKTLVIEPESVKPIEIFVLLLIRVIVVVW